MWAKSLAIVLVISLTSSKACDVNKECDIDMENAAIRSLKESMETFTVDLMNIMHSDKNVEGNVTFSSTNVFIGLFLLMTGAGDGAKNELIAALKLADKDLGAMSNALTAMVTGLELLNTAKIRSEVITIENLSLAEVMIVRNGLNVVEPFVKLLHSLNADAYPKDFAKLSEFVTKRINQWIFNQTGKRNPVTLTSPVDPSTKLLVITGVFFCAKWPDNFFHPAHNEPGTFASVTGPTNVVMMSTFQKLWFYDDQRSFAALQLPFENKNFILHIILPHGPATDAAAFVKSFNMDMWKAILTQSTQVDITVKIPKIATAWTNVINDQIRALKVKSIFQGADFPGMIERANAPLTVSSFTQSAALTINETGISMSDIPSSSTNPAPLANSNNPRAFVVDKPCLVLVRNVKSSLIVFSSYIRQP